MTAEPGLRARHKARTRDELAVAALTLFEERGYDATTCEDIAERSGVSVRTFFRYFDTKADVLFAKRTDDTGPMAAVREIASRRPDEDPIAVIGHALRHPARAVEAHRDVVVRQLRVLMTTESLQQLRRESFHRFEGPLAEALAARVGRRHPGVSERLQAAVAACSLRIAIEEWVAAGAEPGGLTAVLTSVLDEVRAGLGATRPA